MKKAAAHKRLTASIRTLIYFIIVAVLVIGSVEIILRLLGYVHNSPYIIYDKDCYWRMAANQKLNFKGENGNLSTITINSLGARGPEFNIIKPKGEKRIICVGDSFTYGLGVDDAQTFPACLQNLIKGYFANVRVINYGCNGHTILHEVNFIKKYGLRLKPDYVLVATSINTDFDEIAELEFNLGYMPMPGYNFVKFLIRKTAIGNILLKSWNSKKVKTILEYRKELKQKMNDSSGASTSRGFQFVDYLYASEPAKRPNESFDTYLAKLNELIKLSREYNFRVIYVVMPWSMSNPNEAKIDKTYHKESGEITVSRFLKILEDRYGDEITLIELMSSFNSKNLFLLDGHLNAQGNKLAAGIIYKAIKKELLPSQ